MQGTLTECKQTPREEATHPSPPPPVNTSKSLPGNRLKLWALKNSFFYRIVCCCNIQPLTLWGPFYTPSSPSSWKEISMHLSQALNPCDSLLPFGPLKCRLFTKYAPLWPLLHTLYWVKRLTWRPTLLEPPPPSPPTMGMMRIPKRCASISSLSPHLINQMVNVNALFPRLLLRLLPQSCVVCGWVSLEVNGGGGKWRKEENWEIYRTHTHLNKMNFHCCLVRILPLLLFFSFWLAYKSHQNVSSFCNRKVQKEKRLVT